METRQELCLARSGIYTWEMETSCSSQYQHTAGVSLLIHHHSINASFKCVWAEGVHFWAYSWTWNSVWNRLWWCDALDKGVVVEYRSWLPEIIYIFCMILYVGLGTTVQLNWHWTGPECSAAAHFLQCGQHSYSVHVPVETCFKSFPTNFGANIYANICFFIYFLVLYWFLFFIPKYIRSKGRSTFCLGICKL